MGKYKSISRNINGTNNLITFFLFNFFKSILRYYNYHYCSNNREQRVMDMNVGSTLNMKYKTIYSERIQT